MTNDKEIKTKNVAIAEEHWLLLNEIQSVILKKTGVKWTLSMIAQEGISMFAKKEMKD